MLYGFVQEQLMEAARGQKEQYDAHANKHIFDVEDILWLSIPTAGKLDTQWEGGWTIQAVKSPVNMEISDGQRTEVVHINCL